MQTVIIEGNKINYLKKNELANADLGDQRQLYEETYKIAEFISNQLKIKCPDIGFSSKIRVMNQTTGRLSVQGAEMYTPDDISTLKSNLIIMSTEDFKPMQFIGTLAHEMRHIWQHEYAPEMNQKHAVGFMESLMHPAEIDADGFAIWYISNTQNMYIDKAAGIICPEEKKHHPKEYMYRIEKAKEIKAYFDEQREKTEAEMATSKKNNKESILDKIKSIFK